MLRPISDKAMWAKSVAQRLEFKFNSQFKFNSPLNFNAAGWRVQLCSIPMSTAWQSGRLTASSPAHFRQQWFAPPPMIVILGIAGLLHASGQLTALVGPSRLSARSIVITGSSIVTCMMTGPGPVSR
jgi:hypothetical protein